MNNATIRSVEVGGGDFPCASIVASVIAILLRMGRVFCWFLAANP